MASHDYHFLTHWRVAGTVAEVFEVLSDSGELSRWWPSVYLDVHETKQGGEGGIGRELALHTKGWLPYTLKWTLSVLENEPPQRIVIGASGDFDGRGVWILEPDGDFVDVTFDWRIAAEKPLLKHLSFVLKPIFSLNHEWAMRCGEESLNLELQRRRASTVTERDAVPAPPGPTKMNAKTAALIALCGALGAAAWMRKNQKF